MSDLTDIADAVAASLNAAQFGQTFNALRRWQEYSSLEELATLKVSVIPNGEELTPRDRMSQDKDALVFVVVQKKLKAADNAEIDPLAELVEAIRSHLLLNRRLILAEFALKSTITQTPLLDREALRTEKLFQSVIPLTFKVTK